MRKILDASTASPAAAPGAAGSAFDGLHVAARVAPRHALRDLPREAAARVAWPGPAAVLAQPQAGLAERLHAALARCVDRLAAGELPVQVGPPGDLSTRAAGHFHLAPELFLQLGGSTEFRFPHGRLALRAGEALLVPPTLRHDERVRAAGRQEPFSNLVVYAEGGALSCHLAHEARPGRPGIAHLEACRHPQAVRVQEWLADAARLGHEATPAGSDPRAALQVRALVAAATAGVLRLLDSRAQAAPAEPPLVARLRVLVHNQLGDATLSVRGLAQQSGCSADYLSHLFSRHGGEHLVAYITRLRLERAERLLGETELSVKEIAWACGYSTPSYFIRSFRGRHGLTPKAWRTAHAAAG